MYSADQVRHPYIVKRKVEALGETPNAGDLAIKISDGNQPYPQLAVFDYFTGNQEITRADIIELKNIEYINVKAGYKRKLKKLEISFDPSVGGGKPIPGQEYMFRITMYGLGIGGGEVSISRMIGPHIAAAGDTNLTVMNSLLSSFNDNFKREYKQYVKAEVTGADATAKLLIEEVPVPFVLGKTGGNPIDFAVVTTPIEAVDYLPWGKVTNITKNNTNTVPNGVKVADMEYFYAGEKMGNVHQGNSPHSFVPLADPTKVYETVDICYFFKGNNEDTQHSRKMISLFLDPASDVTGADIKALLMPEPAPADSVDP